MRSHILSLFSFLPFPVSFLVSRCVALRSAGYTAAGARGVVGRAHAPAPPPPHMLSHTRHLHRPSAPAYTSLRPVP
ncbi:hypothetical protein CALVIDRAFT_532599 [Calocera viscosa TUFC12733]|uniref:Secreted protein n=1 Tax=Calocera viscosa (strain TUFC12733) TaxID=1330018 RepID=A0A167SER7_CALVF|nr:hypothetical protein CALVIDRAFT_532599 [Calocera viscosa TUFC12733]